MNKENHSKLYVFEMSITSQGVYDIFKPLCEVWCSMSEISICGSKNDIEKHTSPGYRSSNSQLFIKKTKDHMNRYLLTMNIILVI
jgi:hypothetical protein